MASKHFLHTACILLSFLYIESAETVNGRIKITVGTTAGCGDTVRFIHNHLLATHEKYKDYLDLEFLPWGRTRKNEDGTWWCQFSPHNCWANRLHRCALSMLPEQDAQLQYMACEFTSPSPSWNNGSYLCAYESGLNIVDLDHCVSNPGDELDTAAERRGTEIINIIGFVPSIVLNDNIEVSTHNEAFNDLESLICFTLAADASTGVSGCQF